MSEEIQDLRENLIIKFLYTDEKLRERILPYLRFDLFDITENIELIKFIKKFIKRYEKFPSPKETKLKFKNAEAYKHLVRVLKMDTSEYSDELILDEAEYHIREKSVYDVIYKVVDKAQAGNLEELTSTPDEMREALAFTFDDTVGLDIFSDEAEEKMYEHLHSVDNVVSTGLETLDELIEGGFHEKTLNLLMAETNMGKSLIMGALATNNVFEGKNVLYVTCEMSEFKIGERVLQNSLDYSTKDLKKMTRDKFGECFRRAKEKLKSKFIVKEYATGVATVNHIRSLCKELWLKKKFVPDIIYIDYIGIMASTFKNKSDNTYTIQKRITEEVRGLAVELGIPIVSAIQTNRLGMGKEELDLTNTSDSIGTAFTADVMIGVTQTEELRSAFKYRWTLIKNRYGQNKVGLTIKVDYNKMRLSDDIALDSKLQDYDKTCKADKGNSVQSSSKPKQSGTNSKSNPDIKPKPKNRKIIRRGGNKKKDAKITF